MIRVSVYNAVCIIFSVIITKEFQVELQPNAETLSKLALQLNELILNSTKLDALGQKKVQKATDEEGVSFRDHHENGNKDDEDTEMLDIIDHREEPDLPKRVILRLR